MGLLLLIVLIVFLVGGLPRWGYHSFGFAPSGDRRCGAAGRCCFALDRSILKDAQRAVTIPVAIPTTITAQ